MCVGRMGSDEQTFDHNRRKKKQKNNAPKLMRVDRLPLDCGPALTVKLAAAVGTGEEEG